MTVDELLLKLDAEYDKLKSELPKAYEDYGRAAYPKVRDSITGLYSHELVYERDQIKTREARMDYIKVLQSQIRIEKGRLKA